MMFRKFMKVNFLNLQIQILMIAVTADVIKTTKAKVIGMNKYLSNSNRS